MPVVWSDRCLLHDPGSPLEVTSAGFREAGRLLGGLRLPTVLVQEGGYHDAIGERVRETLLGFEGRS
jgi:acetoin utilization deacetylase AcuC-like enzyme